MVKGSAGLAWTFGALALLFAAALPVLVFRAEQAVGDPAAARKRAARTAFVTAVWLAATFALAASGRLSFASVPPTMGIVIVVSLALALRVGFSPIGARLAEGVPLAVLVGVQAFRLPLELLLHRAYGEGLMPVQMSYSGRNFDIVTGITALLLAIVLARRPVRPWIVAGWNVLGLALLLNVLVIALLSAPTALRVFTNEPANVWITHAPWVWLPAVFVPAALAGHIVIFRRLRLEIARARNASPTPAAASQQSDQVPAAV